MYVVGGCEYRVWYFSKWQICLSSKVFRIFGVSNDFTFISVQESNVGMAW